MKKKVTAKGKVTEENDFMINEPDYFKGQVINKFKGKKIVITVEEDENFVSNPQLKYYFGVLVKMIVDHYYENGIDKTKKEIDYLLRYNFLFEEIVDLITGEIFHKPLALNAEETEVGTKRMMKFFARIQRFGSEELDLYLPDPNEEAKNWGLEEPGQAA